MSEVATPLPAPPSGVAPGPATGGHVRWLDPGEMRAWLALLRSTNRLRALLVAELEATQGLGLHEYEVLAVLSDASDRRLRMNDLAAKLHVSPSGMTRRVDALVRRGWVRREQCPEDRRGSFAALTEEGYDVLRAAAPVHVRGVREHFVDRLSARQLAALAGALTKIADD